MFACQIDLTHQWLEKNEAKHRKITTVIMTLTILIFILKNYCVSPLDPDC